MRRLEAKFEEERAFLISSAAKEKSDLQIQVQERDTRIQELLKDKKWVQHYSMTCLPDNPDEF